MKQFKQFFIISLIAVFVLSCSKSNNNPTPINENESKELTIFHINDQHGSIENFAKIKFIVDREKEQTNVLVVSCGDIFSGNPVVDNHEEKGFPMIDLMNMVGFDISVIGNHEFDYGETILKDRFQQSQFEWVCANVSMNNTGIPEPNEYKTIQKKDLKVTFLGLVETNGKPNDIIPSTHPWRVQNLTFEKYYDVISNYAQIKETEQSDLYIALTHLGESTDYTIANDYPYFDLIIGGHSHSVVNTTRNNIPVFQAGSNLNYLGKITLTVKDRKIENINHELIDLNNYPNYDEAIVAIVDNYNENANLDDIIGYAEGYHSKSSVGSFYTDALRIEMEVDVTFQNTGGVRSDLNAGEITKREIYSIDPFNNGSVTYTMTVGEIKNFLKGSKVAVYYSGVYIEQENATIAIRNLNNQLLNDPTTLTIGLNDYIPAVYDTYFTQTPTNKPFTTAETLINYLEHTTDPVNYSQINNYFRFN